jgi:hypothetical protein
VTTTRGDVQVEVVVDGQVVGTTDIAGHLCLFDDRAEVRVG